MNARRRPIVVLGMMAKIPVPGVIWQTLHYLLGLRQLGFDVYYVEAHARTPTMLMTREQDDASARAAQLIDGVLRPYGLGERWAFHALHQDGAVFGLSDRELGWVLRNAELLLNLHGATEPREELADTGRLVYVETDPVQMQIELHHGIRAAQDFLAPHCALFTFAENYGQTDCRLPHLEGYDFRPTRQPVVVDLWQSRDAPGRAFRTVGNFHQPWRDVQYQGQSFGWSKDTEWRKFLRLPQRTGQRFELALSGHQERHTEELGRLGFSVLPALGFGVDIGAYRSFITGARGEFTVAKDQNIRLRTGWFSDRSATFLAAGRAVVTQDTAFGAILPTGEGLFAVSGIDDAAAGIEQVAADPSRAGRAAGEIAREYFDAERVLGRLLTEVGIELRKPRKGQMPPTDNHHEQAPAGASTPGTPAPGSHVQRIAAAESTRPTHLHRQSTVLALIPHYQCEEYLSDCLAALSAQSRPLDGIVVIDDASVQPPISIVRQFPGVTLMSATENSGPYRLVQQVINDTDYDAYLFQDADDWSAPDRLERLLADAEAAQADMIGSQEVRVFCDEPEVVPIQWPVDGNAMFSERATAFPLLHPTTLVSRRAMLAAGGYSMGLRFGGDAEFLRRVHHVARCVNSTHHGYFRRIRQGSLTTAPATAIGTPARKQLMEETFKRAHSNAEKVATGQLPDLTPLRPGPGIKLTRLTGPRLHTRASANPPVRPQPPAPAARRPSSVTGPVFVVGAEHSGASALAAAIGQHPAIALSLHGGWVARLAEGVSTLPSQALSEDPATFGLQPPVDGALSAAFGPAASGVLAPGATRWVDGSWQLAGHVPALAQMFPDARFIHVVRDVHSAVRALADPPLGSAGATGGTQVPVRLRAKISEPEAVERWTQTTQACLDAQRELGPKRMMTVPHTDLVSDPEFTIRRCLDFVGETFAVECLRPTREFRTLVSAAPLEPDVEPDQWNRALVLDREAQAEAGRRRGKRNDGSPARIVMVTDHFPKFSETFFVRKFLGLLHRGWDVHVVCQRSNDEHWRFFPELRAELRHQGRLHVVGDRVDQCIVDLRPDIVHFGYGTLAHGRMHVRGAAGCRIVTSFRGYDLNSFRLDEPGCYDEVFAASDVVHAVSEAIWRRAQQRGCPADKEHAVVTDAVDVTWFEPPADRDEVVGTSERPLRILSVGRLHWKKGHESALQAVRSIVDRGIEVDYRIVGEGDHREPTQFAIRDLGLEGTAELVGAQNSEAVRELLGWADVFLHASLTEAFGVAVIEAQAMGLPVVCSDAGGLPENVEHEVSGYVVPRRAVAAMADGLAALANDPQLRRRMGLAARRRAETELSVDHQLDRFEDIYEELLKRGPEAVVTGSLADTRAAARLDQSAQIRTELESLDARRQDLTLALWRREVNEAVQAFAHGAVPEGAKVLIVSHGDEELVALNGRHGAHFPQATGGGYAGHHPGDSSDAIRQLEQLCEQGAQYLIVPATSGWWLEHYQDLTRHLDDQHRRLEQSGEHFVAFALTRAVTPAQP
jgi:glycosyltransferase involved in cell wall biosynthesis